MTLVSINSCLKSKEKFVCDSKKLQVIRIFEDKISVEIICRKLIFICNVFFVD